MKVGVRKSRGRPFDGGRRKVVKMIAASGVGAIASPWMFQSGQAQARTLKIGFVSPQTGPIAAFGEADEFILNGVRQALKDGLVVNGVKHPVTIVVKDSQSNPSRAAEVTSALIDQDRCDIITGSSTSDTTIPVADQCEVNGVPCVTTDTPWEPWFFGRRGNPAKNFGWTYHFFWGAGDLYRVFLDMWNSVPTNKVVGALWSNDPDGNAIGDKDRGFPAAIKKEGYSLVDAGLYQPFTAASDCPSRDRDGAGRPLSVPLADRRGKSDGRLLRAPHRLLDAGGGLRPVSCAGRAAQAVCANVERGTAADGGHRSRASCKSAHTALR